MVAHMLHKQQKFSYPCTGSLMLQMSMRNRPIK